MARIGVTSGYYVSGQTTDSYGSGSTSNYIPQLYSSKVLYDFYATSVYPEITNTDFEGDFKNSGDKILIRTAPAITTGTYTIGKSITYEVPIDSSQEMVIDQALYQAFRVDDIDKVQSDIDLMNIFAEDAANRLRIAIDTDVLAVMGAGPASANKGNSAGAISGNIALGATGAPISVTTTNAIDKIVHLGQTLDEQNITGERFIVIPSWYSALLKLGDLKRADVTGDATGVIRNGMIGMVDNVKVFVNNNLDTATDGTDTAFYITYGVREATAFAAQVSKTDTLQIPDSFGEYWRTLFVYGRKVIRTEGLATLYCIKG